LSLLILWVCRHHSLLVPLHLNNKTNSAWFHDTWFSCLLCCEGSPSCHSSQSPCLQPFHNTSCCHCVTEVHAVELGRWMPHYAIYCTAFRSEGCALSRLQNVVWKSWSRPFNRHCSKTSFIGVFQLARLAANSCFCQLSWHWGEGSDRKERKSLTIFLNSLYSATAFSLVCDRWERKIPIVAVIEMLTVTTIKA